MLIYVGYSRGSKHGDLIFTHNIKEEVWKCPKHPSKRRRNGVCPVCLKDRLVILCPDCANVRPCSCAAAAATTSSSSSSDGQPNLLRRSGSAGINFLRFSYARSFSGRKNPTATGKSKTPSFWSIVLPSSKSMKEPGV
ncbi:unnamed protein product [Cuscuta campestris]|uniref:Uncharacterized protein n=1 Tax=Cuscuta campestris TaxID=132261 RepID=A0A484NBQ5_9ASTE|nr:unnamed protein product [Cuscuta campestris]